MDQVTSCYNINIYLYPISCLLERGMDRRGNSKISEGRQQISRWNTQQVAEDSGHGGQNHGGSELTRLLNLKFQYFHLHQDDSFKS